MCRKRRSAAQGPSSSEGGREPRGPHSQMDCGVQKTAFGSSRSQPVRERPSAKGGPWADGLGRGDYKIFSESSKRHYFLQVLSSLEANVDWVDGEITYFDEFSSVREYRGTVLKTKDRYQEQLTKWLEKTKKNVHGCGGAYMQVTDLTAISRYVSFLTAKARMKDQ